MSKNPKNVEIKSNTLDTVFVVQLLQAWLEFIDAVGKYAKRYYLSLDLEKAPQEQDPMSEVVMKHYYGTIGSLHGTIQSDLRDLPGKVRAIEEAQVACCLPHIHLRDEYVDQIIMGFAIKERHGKERRDYYRQRLQRTLKNLNKGKTVKVLSLNQLEAYYQKNQARAEKRAAEKAARVKQETEDTQAAMLAAYDEETNTVHLPK